MTYNTRYVLIKNAPGRFELIDRTEGITTGVRTVIVGNDTGFMEMNRSDMEEVYRMIGKKLKGE